jgi:hypothetical protein
MIHPYHFCVYNQKNQSWFAVDTPVYLSLLSSSHNGQITEPVLMPTMDKWKKKLWYKHNTPHTNTHKNGVLFSH